ncbi:hypothetical protein A4A49_11048 [Nicotiana attenuata]|uniref:Uncharacterized protein n=1 Tax=Nicotiana attenuata TaxID=49451 RepID=A0A1J6JM43_NICAT|nr:hypothetical protein A4A49_11048 [Nicotiana attenuata]
MHYNSVGGFFVQCPKTQKFFPIENDYQLLNLIKDPKDGDLFDVYVSHVIDNLEVVEEDVPVGYLPSSQVGDSDQATTNTKIRGGPGVSVHVGEGIGVNIDDGIGVNYDEGINVTLDEGINVNVDEGIGVNVDEGIGVSVVEDIEVNTAEGSAVNTEQSRATFSDEDINVEESAAAEHDNTNEIDTNLEDDLEDFGEDDLEDIIEEDDSEIDDELRSVRNAAREVKRNRLKKNVNDAGSQSKRKQRKKPISTEEIILGEAGIDKGHKSVITMLEEIRHKMMSRQVDMIKFVETWASDISPMARLVLEENMEIGRKLKVQWYVDTGFEVNDDMYRHNVDIQKKRMQLQIMAVKRKDTFLAAYQYYIQLIPSMQMWTESTNPSIEPPEVKPMPGRPKKCRRKDKDEPKKWEKLSKKGAKMSYSICHQVGHNKSVCSLRIRRNTPSVRGRGTVGSGGRGRGGGAGRGRGGKLVAGSVTSGVAISATTRSLTASVGKKRTRNSGFGLYTDTQIGTNILNHGRPTERVISIGANLMNAAQTNVDLGFRLNGLKWKGNRAVTGNQLQKQRDAAISNEKMKVGTSTSSTPIDSCQSQI